ncbi:AAA family ATPase [Actinopolyspora mortivallis]|uniref:AAA family ATPase n=1 Tax=Actinopolyspora mortivallis TaxID=33906 RepID=UPI00036AB077|nr:ATP-dependent Clp protease ATP-binding subunit [Actinopolyspora mortivallis]
MPGGRTTDPSPGVESLLDELLSARHTHAETTPPATGLLDEQARTVLSTAVHAARDWGSSALDDTHLLWALTQTEPTARMLRETGVAVDRLARSLRTLAGAHEAAAGPDRPWLTTAARQALLGSYRQARHEGTTSLAPRHLLLGVATDADSAAGRALARAIEQGDHAPSEPPESSTPWLERFGLDLTHTATTPLVGREEQLDRIAEILARHGKNTPVLVGEPGVGKTALVEGLAHRLRTGQAPRTLADRKLVALDITTLVAGTHNRGDLEHRLGELLREITEHRTELLVFIDEIHLLTGAGAADGLDAATVLKPALARGHLPLIGATTTEEYRRHIEKDPALERRFHPVHVPEPTVAETVRILRGLRTTLQNHHQLRITDRALHKAAELSERYIADRFLPDKAVDVLDHACAHLRVHHEHEPTPRVDADTVAEIVATRTGIPVTELDTHERTRLQQLHTRLSTHVVGQPHATRTVADAVRRARTGLADPNRPLCSFLFTGPTGVGKTELAHALTHALFGETSRPLRFDMGEFQEKHTVSRLLGAPPGYLGHDEAGQLTDSIRRHPYSVLLLDEIEKAHPDILNTLLQVLDAGRLTDSTGATVDFTNTVVVMTSNIGARRALSESDSEPGEPTEELAAHFRPEFLNRIDEIVPFAPLGTEDLARITLHLITTTRERLREHGIRLHVTDSAVHWLTRRGHHHHFGARHLRRTVERELHTRIAALLTETPQPLDLHVDTDGDDGLTVTPVENTDTAPTGRHATGREC